MPLKEKYFSAFTGSPAGELSRSDGGVAGKAELYTLLRTGECLESEKFNRRKEIPCGGLHTYILCYFAPAALLSASTLSVCSQGRSISVLPTWPRAAT